MKYIKNFFKYCLYVIKLVFLILVILNLVIIINGILKTKDLNTLEKNELSTNVPIVVFGAGVINNETPSLILRERLDKAVEIHKLYPNNPIIVTGDHAEDNYNEVAVMKSYLVDKDIPSELIYQDHAGFSTYESMYRLKHVFKQEEAVLVTQAYHLPRSLMCAQGLGIDVIGVSASDNCSNRIKREAREVLARVKDFILTIAPSLSDEITEDYPINLAMSGDLTDDKELLQN